jgi:hypothetical protein
MNLYEVQDSDRPMYVIARSWDEALSHWQRVIALENNADIVVGPLGIRYVCGPEDLILPDPKLNTDA